MSLARKIGGYSISNIFLQLMSAVTAFLRPKLLTPAQFGLWNLLNVIPMYATYLHFGTRDIVRYQIPVYTACGDEEKAREAVGTLYFGSLATSLALSACLIAAAAFWPGSLVERIGLVAFAGITMLNWYFEYNLALLKAHQLFGMLSRLNYIRPVLSFVLTLTLAGAFAIYGLYAATFLVMLVLIVFIRRAAGTWPRGIFSWPIYVSMVKKGLPITLFGLAIAMLITMGRFFVAGYLGDIQLGYYGLSTMAFTGLMRIPGAAREVIEPLFMTDSAKSANRESRLAGIESFFLRPLLTTAATMPFLLAGVLYAFPPFVHYALPRYEPGVVATLWAVPGIYFLSLSFVFRGLLVALGLQARVLWVIIPPIGLNALLMWGALHPAGLGMGIEAASIATSISQCALLLGLIWFTNRHIPEKPVSWKRTHLRLSLPPLILGLAYGMLYFAFSHLSMLAYHALAGTLFCILALLVYVILSDRGQNLGLPSPLARWMKKTDGRSQR
ncbi:lipopolysaccharide biosynthesis protein [Desulfovibrio inopinatus]|uniref:lipopolysaccharide biosynthesis protein n=1 Tax=Desulfovibrio inopinatus TaxID=102109 RepID=UPI0004295E63|nr:polysaccharide biosynthesis C-terminal domain-containing protein [Desulfovibrio inopinatus]